jgi:lipopolysaccharide assembly outer membrane protein LptD (OstA)
MLGGTDVVEPGARVGYGLGYGAQTGPLAAGLDIGQFYRPESDREFEQRTGIGDGFSDVVLGANLAWDNQFQLGYQTAVDNLTDLNTRFRSVNASANIGSAAGSVAYVFADDAFNGGLTTGHTEYVSGDLRYAFDDNLSARIAAQHDLNEGETRDLLAMLSYGDECTIVSLSFRRTFYNNNPEVAGRSDSYLLSINLLTLGDQVIDLGP